MFHKPRIHVDSLRLKQWLNPSLTQWTIQKQYHPHCHSNCHALLEGAAPRACIAHGGAATLKLAGCHSARRPPGLAAARPRAHAPPRGWLRRCLVLALPAMEPSNQNAHTRTHCEGHPAFALSVRRWTWTAHIGGEWHVSKLCGY